MMLRIADGAPLSYPAGTEVEYRGPGHNHLNVEVRIPGARHSMYLSPRWLDWPAEDESPVPVRRRLRVCQGVLS